MHDSFVVNFYGRAGASSFDQRRASPAAVEVNSFSALLPNSNFNQPKKARFLSKTRKTILLPR